MSLDLFLRGDCLPGLLDGWHGPVECPNEGRRGTSVVLIATKGTGHVIANEDGGSTSPVQSSSLFLDLTRPECRDRVARVLARALGIEGFHSATAPSFGLVKRFRGSKFEKSFWAFGLHEEEFDEVLIPALGLLDPKNPWYEFYALAIVVRWVRDEIEAGRLP